MSGVDPAVSGDWFGYALIALAVLAAFLIVIAVLRIRISDLKNQILVRDLSDEAATERDVESLMMRLSRTLGVKTVHVAYEISRRDRGPSGPVVRWVVTGDGRTLGEGHILHVVLGQAISDVERAIALATFPPEPEAPKPFQSMVVDLEASGLIPPDEPEGP